MPLTVQAPEGAHFAFDEVKTDKGTRSLGDVPILVWDDCAKMIEFYGEQAILDMADGTSFRVSFQSTARRLKVAQKEGEDADDKIAEAQVKFRPGKREVGQSTPVSRAANAAKKAAEKVDGDVLAALLKKIESGELSNADLAALAG